MNFRVPLIRTIPFFIMLVVLVIAALSFYEQTLPDYQQNRVRTFLNPVQVQPAVFSVEQTNLDVNQGIGTGRLQATQSPFSNSLIVYSSTILAVLLLLFMLVRPSREQPSNFRV
jgi:cell division protein FtsW (lipid II flippase)